MAEPTEKKVTAGDEWVVYCTTCPMELDRMRNGSFAEALVSTHLRSYPEHRCLVSLEYGGGR
jgi:hypothetical protein